MANQIVITHYYSDGAFVVEAEIADTSDADFPRDVFLHKVNKDGSLGEFQAIGHADQVARYPTYDPERTSNFGIHLVKYESMRKSYETEELKDKAIIVLKSAFDNLVESFEEVRTPVQEVYPGV